MAVKHNSLGLAKAQQVVMGNSLHLGLLEKEVLVTVITMLKTSCLTNIKVTFRNRFFGKETYLKSVSFIPNVTRRNIFLGQDLHHCARH